jgi:hypothetical protein
MGRLRPRFKSHEQSRTTRSPTDMYDAAVRHFLSKRYGPAEDRCRQALTLDGFIMGEGRRYAHSASYVRASIEAAGLVVLQLEQQSTRYERRARAKPCDRCGEIVNCSPRPLKFLALAVTMHPDPPKAAVGVSGRFSGGGQNLS